MSKMVPLERHQLNSPKEEANDYIHNIACDLNNNTVASWDGSYRNKKIKQKNQKPFWHA